MIHRRKWGLAGIGCCVALLVTANSLWAFYVDGKKRSLEVKGKIQTRTSFRLQKSDGFTYPYVPAGNLVQWRNLGLLEINHDLKYLMRDLDILYPFKALGLRVKYHILGRFMYEGIYDFGPDVFQDVRDADKENIDDFKQSYDLWVCYVDISRGPMFLRLGRQNLAWGETDVFRLLDYINPLDNTYGGIFEDLDDRRMPLRMARGSYVLGDLGPISSITLEGFWVPGFWDVHMAPMAPTGTVYAAPAPSSPLEKRMDRPEKKMSNSRWGVRLMGLVGQNFNISLAHYKTFLDSPSLNLEMGPAGPTDVWMRLSYPDVQITGASMSFWESHTDVIVRTEVAWFWDEPVFIPAENTPIIPLPIAIPGIPGLPAQGRVPKKDILRYMLGFDKRIWIRPLNHRTTFLFSFQYFGQWIPDYDDRMRLPLSLYPDTTRFIGVKETESTFTSIMSTDYYNGRLIPQLVLAYDVRGAWMIQPSANLVKEPFRLKIQYSAIAGNFVSFGAFRDRDQLTLIFSYLLN